MKNKHGKKTGIYLVEEDQKNDYYEILKINSIHQCTAKLIKQFKYFE